MPDADEVDKKPILKIPLLAAAETGTPDNDEVNRMGSASDSQSDGEDQDVLSTKRLTVRELQPGDLLLWGIPPHAQEITAIRHERLLGRMTSRYVVSLSDADGVREDYALSPGRRLVITTDRRMPVAPWSDVSRQFFEEMSHDDSVWRRRMHRLLLPIQPILSAIRDLQCFSYSVRLQAGFVGILFVVLVFAFGLDSLLDSRISVVISIVGAFTLERCWSYWRKRVRRVLSEGLCMTIKFRPFGPLRRYRYGTLDISKTGAIITGGQNIKPWSSAQLRLLRRKPLRGKVVALMRMTPRKWLQFIREKEELAVTTFANDIRGDLTYTCRNIADAIRHRLNDGSNRTLYVTSTKYDPDKHTLPDVTIHPGPRGDYFDMSIRDKRGIGGAFTLKLNRYQMRVLADMLEVMDDMRRL